MGIPYRVYRMDIPYRAYHTVSYSKLRRHSTNVRQDNSFLLFIKAFISANVFKYYQSDDFIFFPVFFFMVFLKILTLLSQPDTKHGPWRAVGSTILTEKSSPRCFSRRRTKKRLEQPKKHCTYDKRAPTYNKLDHWIIQFQSSDWLSHQYMSHSTILSKYGNCTRLLKN